jgi:hypothetical protein
MTTVFEELPPAISTPYGNGSTIWTANFLATGPEGGVAACTVKAIVHQDKASDIRLKQEQRGNLMCGMLIDARGVVYGISSVYVGGQADDHLPSGEQEEISGQLGALLGNLVPGYRLNQLEDYRAVVRALKYLVDNMPPPAPEVEDGW